MISLNRLLQMIIRASTGFDPAAEHAVKRDEE